MSPDRLTVQRIRALLDEWETREPGTPMLAVMGLRRALGEKPCTYCGNYAECRCDDAADWQSTEGY